MIERIIILSLSAIAICCTTWEGMIFEKPAAWLERKLGVWLCKPLFGCFICATFWYSAGIAAFIGWQWYLCLPAMGFSAVLSMLQND